MPFNAPTYRGAMQPGAWERRQEAGTHAEGYDPALSADIQQLPSYQAWVQSLQRPGATGQGVGGTAEWKALIADLKQQGIAIPENEVLDSQTGTVRGKTWTERHPVLAGILTTAGFAGGGAALGAVLGGGAAASAAGAGALGPTTPASMAATDIAAAGGSGTMLGGATVPAALGGSGAMPAVGSTLGTIGKIANIGRDVGGAISNASSAAGANRRTDAQIGQNAQGTYENALLGRAALEGTQRKDALKDIYRSSFYRNEKPGPYDTKGLPQVSPEYLDSLSSLEKQGLARLKADPTYDASKFKPLEEKAIPEASGLEQAGSWVGPTLSTIGLVSKYFT